MERNKRLFKTTIIYFIGTFGSKLLVFFLMPLYSAYLSTEQFGTVNLVTNIVPLIGPIFTLQVTETIFRFLCTSKNENEKKSYITNSLIIFALGIIIFILLYIPICVKIKFQYSYLFIIYFIFNYLSLYLQQVLRGMKKSIDYSVTGVVSTLIQLIVNVLLIKSIHERSILLATVLGTMVITIYALIRLKFFNYIDLKLFNKDIIKKILNYSLPLVPNQISWWLNGTAGLYILKFVCGTSATGLVSFANKFPSLLMTVNSIFLLAWTENSIYEYDSEDKEKYYSKNLESFSKFLILFSAFLLPIIKVYYEFFISVTYHDSITLVPLMFISMMFNAIASFIGTIYTASMKTKGAFYTTIVAGVVNIVASFILIPIFNIYGYVLSNIISYVTFYITRKRSIDKIVKLQYNYKLYCFPIVVFVISSIIYIKTGIIFNIISLFIQILIIIYMYRKLIYIIIKGLKIKLIERDKNAKRL